MSELPPFTSSSLIDRIEKCWIEGTAQQQASSLAMAGQAIAAQLIEEGDQAQAGLTHLLQHADKKKADYLDEVAKASLQVFEWTDGAKRFVLLWRNTLIQWERATVLNVEGHCDAEQLRVLAKASKEKLQAAVRHWFGAFEDQVSAFRQNKPQQDKAIYTYSLQNSPWPTYRKQLEALNAQILELDDNFETCLNAAKTLCALSGELLTVPRQLDETLDELRARANRAIDIINEAEAEQPGNVSTSRLEHLDPKELVLPEMTELTRQSNDIIDRLPEKVKLYVCDDAGELMFRDVNLERQTGQWLSAEVLPDLQRGGRAVEQMAADLSRTLVDVRNRILLARDTKAVVVSEPTSSTEKTVIEGLGDLREPLESFAVRLNRVREEVGNSAESSLHKVRQELKLSRVYNPNLSFLEVSFEAGMSQVRRTQDALFTRFTTWLVEQKRKISKLRKQVAVEERLSVGERIVRVLRTRKADPKNQAYTSVLVTRGFIGEAFHAGREAELVRAKNAIEAAQEGFRGSIAITGQRYSGKTHFAELLAGRYFEQKTVRLRAGAPFEVSGRTMPGTHDLRAALAFVRKHSVNKRLLVLVDDLELWWDDSYTLSANVEALKEAMDALSGRLFFLVTMCNWTFARLQQTQQLGAAFQVEINMDGMEIESFMQTVLTRHAATHLILIGKDEKELSEATIRDRAETIFRSARMNVGDGLRRWAQAVERCDSSRVKTITKVNHSLPNFIDAETGVVLAVIKRKRYVNEYQLRKLFGPAFDAHYRAVVQRLIRLDILVRHRSGSLNINPVVSNEIGRLLQRENHLQSEYINNPIQL